jgi:hypothetical protein
MLHTVAARFAVTAATSAATGYVYSCMYICNVSSRFCRRKVWWTPSSTSLSPLMLLSGMSLCICLYVFRYTYIDSSCEHKDVYEWIHVDSSTSSSPLMLLSNVCLLVCLQLYMSIYYIYRMSIYYVYIFCYICLYSIYTYVYIL